MCLSSKTTGRVRDAAYRFMNWWLSGWPGAFIARQGYYISNPGRSREHLTDDEWQYWYGGGEARTDLTGTDGRIAVRAGSVRTGGLVRASLQQRGRVEHRPWTRTSTGLTRWYDFLSA